MKRFPNQISDFRRIKDALSVIAEMIEVGTLDPSRDSDFGYNLVRLRRIGFRDLPGNPTSVELEARIAEEMLKHPSNQSPQTTARDLRRILRSMGWLTEETELTRAGADLLDSPQGSYEEQAALVAGLLNVQAVDGDGNTHHPVQTLLRLLAIHSSYEREGLELALAPLDDSDEEFERIALMYDMDRATRIDRLGITPALRANAVKIFPTLAVAAGLVFEEAGLFSLSQDGWAVLGQEPQEAAAVINRRRGRRTTSGRLVNGSTIASRQRNNPPRTLSPEEQARAANRLNERTNAHQDLVRRVYHLIGERNGDVFEDEFSYDMLWVPQDPNKPAYLFEMKTITSETDAYARVRDAVGQLHYYEHFNAQPTLGPRQIQLVTAFDDDIPDPLLEFLRRQNVGAIVSAQDSPAKELNLIGRHFFNAL